MTELVEKPLKSRFRWKRVENPGGRSRGFVETRCGKMIPFKADYHSIDGAHVHFWIGPDDVATSELLTDLCQIVESHHEIVQYTHSGGSPDGFSSYELLRRK